MMNTKHLLKGLIKSIPGIELVHDFHKETGGTNNARYCYSVWMRHLIHAYKSGMTAIPRKIGELGPGDSLGIGLAALISGAEQYYAFDIIKYFDSAINLKVLDELVDLFKNKTPVPGPDEFKKVKPELENYDFPVTIFPQDYLVKVLDNDRLGRIRTSIRALDNPVPANTMITFRDNWIDSTAVESGSLDMIFSQAVLEYIDDLDSVYKTMHQWLRPGGIISNEIDFKSTGIADTWDGHWTYSDWKWKIIRGRNKFFITREPYSTHIRLLNENHFTITCDLKSTSTPGVTRPQLAKRFRNLKDVDLATQSVFLQATKR
jgi:SAM-dependent methyltransferase